MIAIAADVVGGVNNISTEQKDGSETNKRSAKVEVMCLPHYGLWES